MTSELLRGPASEVAKCIHNSVYWYYSQWYLPFNHPLTILAR